ncbi:hypothetical protein OG21DRAFT_1484724 [Imleria badia]|nr:hypothetical protein OG21DRAFT_1484724 [Imleria badia]
MTDDPTSCVDSIDGTTNFVISFCCISLGLIYQKHAVLCVAYNPFLDSVLAAETVISRPETPYIPMISNCNAFLCLAEDAAAMARGQMAHALRTTESGALNCCLVAQDAIDVFWEIGCWPWDVCLSSPYKKQGGVSRPVLSLHQNAPDVDPFTLTPEVLMGREFLVVRAMPATQGETGREVQFRLANEFYETIGNTTLMLRGRI